MLVGEAARGGATGERLVNAMSDGVDAIVRTAFAEAFSAEPWEGVSLLALGGYGRRELAPYSDVDLMLLVPPGDEARAERFARRLFTPLWDLGLEPGTSVRTEAQTLEFVSSEQTAATALLDARSLCGSEEAAHTLLSQWRQRLVGERLEWFIREKRNERDARRERFGGSVYLLEPNLKMGVGGLRDLAAGLWVAGARHGIDGLSGVAHLGLLPRRQIDRLREARERLFRLRCELHLLSRRRDDRLTFAAQEQLARRLGYLDTPESLAVEQLMRDYYLAAQSIDQASEALLERCAEAPGRIGRRPVRVIDDRFELFDGRVTFRDTLDVAAHPEAWVELFVVAEGQGAPVSPVARDLVIQLVEQQGAVMVASGRPLEAFLRYLERPGAVGTALRGLYETGLLGSLFPEFARLRAQVQHDVYHVFTVDTHTLFALQKCLRLRAGIHAAEQPIFTRIAQALPRPLAVLLGVFFHDLGKGLGGDHATRGEAIVRQFGARAEGLDASIIDDAAFLVREHLELSQVAFRRDLSDPQLIASVAALVGTRERLDMLYLLTYVDISSVGPETWNDWRSRLLEELYEKVRDHLDAPMPSGLLRTRTAAAEAGAAALLAANPRSPEFERFASLLPERHLATVPTGLALQQFEVWQKSQGKPVFGALVPRPRTADAGELVILADDRPGLLAAIAGTLAAHSIDILAAELFTLADSRVLDTFTVREPGGLPPAASRVAQALADLERVLSGAERVDALWARRHGSRARLVPGPAVPTKVRFDLAAARDATVVDVYTQDRLGLLHDIAAAIHSAGATIVLARVATEGNRATDAFYLQDADGRKITSAVTLAGLESALRDALS